MKPGSERMIWPCAHILKIGDRYETINYALGDFETKIRVDCTHWVACPICLAKRPEEPMTLADKIWKWLQDHHYDTDVCGRHLAELTKEHYFGPENEKALAEYMKNNGTLFIDVFAKRICSWFRSLK